MNLQFSPLINLTNHKHKANAIAIPVINLSNIVI